MSNQRPVLRAFVVLLASALIAAGFDWFGSILPAQIVIFSNIAMLAVATSGFFTLCQASALGTARLSTTLSNLTVSALAFFMNINVFGYAVRRDHLPDDLWGWHTIWIICAGVQALFLSGFAQRVSIAIKNQAPKAAASLAKAFKSCNKGILLIYLSGFAVWSAYLGIQISGRGVQAVISDTQILWGSVLLLLVWVAVGVLLYVVPTVCAKIKQVVAGMGTPKQLALGPGIPKQSSSKQSCPTSSSPRMEDVLITFLAYIIIPLALVYVIAITSDAVQQVLATEDHSWQQVLDALCQLLQHAESESQT